MITPPFCPYKECSQHFEGKHRHWYRCYGHHCTEAFGKVQRYQCLDCKRTFSDQTFSLNYYAKRVISYEQIFRQLRSTAGIRDLSRNLEISRGSVENRLFRMAHWALGFHALSRQHMSLKEDLVADGFEGYLHSRYFPHHLNILIGKETQYFYAMDFTTLRRKGRMSPSQKLFRRFLDRVCRPDPKGIEKSMARLAEEILHLFAGRHKPVLKIYTDDHHAYPRAFRRHKAFNQLLRQGSIIHDAAKGTKQPGRVNNLFAVNYMDRQFRKDIVNYVRYTVNTARNVSALLERVCVYRLHHNCIKPYRENWPNARLWHWNLAGVNVNLVTPMLESRFVWRPFVTFLDLTPGERGLWYRLYRTPLKKGGEYLPKYSYS